VFLFIFFYRNVLPHPLFPCILVFVFMDPDLDIHSAPLFRVQDLSTNYVRLYLFPSDRMLFQH